MSRFEGLPRFKRLFVSVGSCIDIAYGIGLRFSAVDAAFSKHSIYRDGFLHLLTTRDSNNKVLVLAWAICETESGDTYDWFAAKCHEAGLSRYLSDQGSLWSDRMKGIEKFTEKFKAHVGKCMNHIIGNARKHVKGSGRTFTDESAWALQRAKTRPEYDKELAKITQQSPAAAFYFDALNHEEVFQYALNEKKVATHGHKTSSIVECGNSFLMPARYEAPYRQNGLIAKWIGKEFEARLQTIEKWISLGHTLTPYAHEMWSIQVCPGLVVMWYLWGCDP